MSPCHGLSPDLHPSIQVSSRAPGCVLSHEKSWGLVVLYWVLIPERLRAQQIAYFTDCLHRSAFPEVFRYNHEPFIPASPTVALSPRQEEEEELSRQRWKISGWSGAGCKRHSARHHQRRSRRRSPRSRSMPTALESSYEDHPHRASMWPSQTRVLLKANKVEVRCPGGRFCIPVVCRGSVGLSTV